MPDKYTINAIYIPALLLLIPVNLLIYYHQIHMQEWLSNIAFEITFGDIAITANIVLVFLWANTIRYLGKHLIENKIYKHGFDFPTTRILLNNSLHMSSSKKQRILELVAKDFNIDTESLSGQDEQDRRLEIKSYVDLIRSKVKDGHLVLEHNIRYGQIRNFLGGLNIVLFLYIVNAVYILYDYSNVTVFEVVLLFLTVTFGIVLFFKKAIIDKYAFEYANKLFDEYITLEREGN